MFRSILYYLTDFLTNEADLRSNHLIFVQNIHPLLVLVLAADYLLFALCIGPALMKNYPPFEFRGAMVFYNVFMAFCNTYSFYMTLNVMDYGKKLLIFEYPRREFTTESIAIVHMGYLYWCTKLLDLFDTVFFVLRKKHNQITALHLYHHAIVPVFGYLALKVGADIPGLLLFASINSFIHMAMYFYYALSAMGPAVQKYLWWKEYITIMQLWQFVIYGVYCVLLFLFQTNYPWFWFYVVLTQPPLFFWLFYDFYSKAYRKKLEINSISNNNANLHRNYSERNHAKQEKHE